MAIVKKSKQTRAKQAAREKSNRAHRRAMGTCTRCGKRRPAKGRRLCGECGQKNVEALARTRAKRKTLGPDVTKRMADRNKSAEIFAQALKGAQFGPDPGYVDVWVRCHIYDPVSQTMRRLPGESKELRLLISSAEEIDEMFRVIARSVGDWAAGVTPRM